MYEFVEVSNSRSQKLLTISGVSRRYSTPKTIGSLTEFSWRKSRYITWQLRHKTILLTANMIITGRAEFPCIASFGKHSSSYQNNSENGNHSSCHSLAKAFTASFRRTSALGWIFDSGCPHRFRHSEFRLSCLLTVVKFQSFGSLHNHSLSSSTPAAQGHQGGYYAWKTFTALGYILYATHVLEGLPLYREPPSVLDTGCSKVRVRSRMQF